MLALGFFIVSNSGVFRTPALGCSKIDEFLEGAHFSFPLMPSSITSHGAFLLALAALGQSRVFLWRRVILFDHELDRHAVKLLENESPIDHRVRH
jgi:hypothetical protein